VIVTVLLVAYSLTVTAHSLAQRQVISDERARQAELAHACTIQQGRLLDRVAMVEAREAAIAAINKGLVTNVEHLVLSRGGGCGSDLPDYGRDLIDATKAIGGRLHGAARADDRSGGSIAASD
jgi:hypothetical protein